MYRALHFVAASAFVLSAGPGIAADIPCQGTDLKTLHETGFHFFDASKSHKWRATVIDGGHCTQLIYHFLPPHDPANKSGNDFKVEPAAAGGVLIPGCTGPQSGNPASYGGKIDAFCSTVAGDPRRWAAIAIWNSGEYHGAAYATINYKQPAQPLSPQPIYVGVGVDPVNEHMDIKYFLAAEP